jgi:hypothetical protein
MSAERTEVLTRAVQRFGSGGPEQGRSARSLGAGEVPTAAAIANAFVQATGKGRLRHLPFNPEWLQRKTRRRVPSAG